MATGDDDPEKNKTPSNRQPPDKRMFNSANNLDNCPQYHNIGLDIVRTQSVPHNLHAIHQNIMANGTFGLARPQSHDMLNPFAFMPIREENKRTDEDNGEIEAQDLPSRSRPHGINPLPPIPFEIHLDESTTEAKASALASQLQQGAKPGFGRQEST